MSKPRTFQKREIKDAIAAAAEHDMEVRFLPDGEMRIVHRTPQPRTVDADTQTEADKALSDWENQHGGHVEGRA